MPNTKQKLTTFPVFFKVAEQKIVIIGNGAEAYAKLRLLSESSACLVLIADAPEKDLLEFINHYSLEDKKFIWLAEKFIPDHLHNALLVFAANGNEKQDKIIAEHANALKIAVNVVDRPYMCDFYTPALINRAPISIAIGSEGASPVLAQMIRAQIEALLHAHIGKVAILAAKLRTLVDHSIAKGLTRRNFWFRFFNSTITEKIAQNNIILAENEAFDLVNEFKTQTGKVYLLNAENLAVDQITLYCQRILLMADGIVYDQAINKDLLTIGRRDAQRFAVAPHSLNQDHNWQKLIQLQQSGMQIVRLYGNKKQMNDDSIAMQKNGYDFTIVPSLADKTNDKSTTAQHDNYTQKAA